MLLSFKDEIHLVGTTSAYVYFFGSLLFLMPHYLDDEVYRLNQTDQHLTLLHIMFKCVEILEDISLLELKLI